MIKKCEWKNESAIDVSNYPTIGPFIDESLTAEVNAKKLHSNNTATRD